jgi:hypothetical protein
MRVQRYIDIKSTPGEIWPFLIESNKIMKWCFTLKHFEYTSKSHEGIGATFNYKEKGKIRDIAVDCVVTEWIKNQKISFKMIEGTGLKTYEETWMITKIQNGIRFSFIQNYELPYGIIGKLIGPISRQRAIANVDKMLARLKTAVEMTTDK